MRGKRAAFIGVFEALQVIEKAGGCDGRFL